MAVWEGDLGELVKAIRLVLDKDKKVRIEFTGPHYENRSSPEQEIYLCFAIGKYTFYSHATSDSDSEVRHKLVDFQSRIGDKYDFNYITDNTLLVSKPKYVQSDTQKLPPKKKSHTDTPPSLFLKFLNLPQRF